MFKKLFNALFKGEIAQSPEVEPIEYMGYLIYPEPMAEGGNTGWQVASPGR